MSKTTRAVARDATFSVLSVDYSTATPSMPVRRKTLGVDSATRQQRQRARTRSHNATMKLRGKLSGADVVQQDDSSWAIVRNGVVVSVFSTVGEAVAAL